MTSRTTVPQGRIEIQHHVEGIRAHERAHVGSNELRRDLGRARVLSRPVEEKLGEINGRNFQASLSERNRVATGTTAEIEHPVCVVAAQSEQ